jgi:hypothetical protein
MHYHTLIKDFGAPGGLCSSITESRHITAMKKPWQRSSQYEALGQMLLINQRLNKLMAIHSDFISYGMMPAGHIPSAGVLFLPPLNGGPPMSGNHDGHNDDDPDVGPVNENVLGHVVLTRACSEYCITYLCELGTNIQ